jgi:3-hydroxyisobutyrate dehydrogenase-like beta-hydroxyacid dehydrogenase
MRYGFIGLGNLGAKLAANLVRAGFDVTVHDLNLEAAASLIAAGAKWADTAKTLGEAVDAAFTCLPSPAGHCHMWTPAFGKSVVERLCKSVGCGHMFGLT